MLNPVRVRIIQELAARQTMTATELCEKLSDVPRTTLYRHINTLLEYNLLVVVSEKKIRGSLERTLSLNIEQISRNNTLENAPKLALSFLMNKYAKFQKYFSGENPDPGRDKIFLTNSVLMMNDVEFEKFLSDLRDLLLRNNFEVASGRKARDISVISVPAEKE